MKGASQFHLKLYLHSWTGRNRDNYVTVIFSGNLKIVKSVYKWKCWEPFHSGRREVLSHRVALMTGSSDIVFIMD